MAIARFRRRAYMGLALLICSLTSGCARFQGYIPDSPLAVCQSSIDAIDDVDITNLYKTYFPENKPELSYKIKTKNKQIKFFISPGVSYNRGSVISGGLEVKY